MANGSVLIGPWPIVVIAAIHFTLYVYYKVRAFSENSYIFGQTPHVALILVRIALRVLGREQGKLYDSQPGQTAEAGTKVTENHDAGKCIGPSADEVVTIKNYRVSEDVLEKYKELFHEEDNATVPLCFPESLFMTSVLLLVSKPQFKLSPLGLIHTGQTIKQHEDLQILLEAPVTLEARTVEYRIVPKGVEVDIEMRVISALDQCVWSGVATLLSRSPQVQKSGSAPSTAGYQNSESDWDKQGSYHQVELKVAGDTGLKYARVSGDWNPHHLYPWSASLLGYRAPIAHGMWTLSRVMTFIKEAKTVMGKSSKLEGKFKRPLFLPGTALLEFYQDEDVVHFRVMDQKTRAPHLIGTLAQA